MLAFIATCWSLSSDCAGGWRLSCGCTGFVFGLFARGLFGRLLGCSRVGGPAGGKTGGGAPHSSYTSCVAAFCCFHT